ncbi:hypothetical protein [Streptomyces phaeochromogenes]|uniref:hypothetical protein n=1 Tax=Streptomyces phaeochromogenes TaxID=1923 RepID=UPI00371D8C9E
MRHRGPAVEPPGANIEDLDLDLGLGLDLDLGPERAAARRRRRVRDPGSVAVGAARKDFALETIHWDAGIARPTAEAAQRTQSGPVLTAHRRPGPGPGPGPGKMLAPRDLRPYSLLDRLSHAGPARCSRDPPPRPGRQQPPPRSWCGVASTIERGTRDVTRAE